MSFDIPKDWMTYFQNEFEKEYFINLQQFLNSQEDQGKIVYPHGSDIFSAFKFTKFKDVKVVIIGQDPYHGEGQAHGLSFSVRPGHKVPPSLKNIYKELNRDLGISPVEHGYLESWAKSGVLMINSVLTVEAKSPGSHRKKGWEQFTDFVIQLLNSKFDNLVFILWGRDAQAKGQNIDRDKHLVLESAHPSPFSARNFHGNSHFSKVNEYLQKNGKAPVNWQLPEQV